MEQPDASRTQQQTNSKTHKSPVPNLTEQGRPLSWEKGNNKNRVDRNGWTDNKQGTNS
jgi:hypothetical protein